MMKLRLATLCSQDSGYLPEGTTALSSRNPRRLLRRNTNGGHGLVGLCFETTVTYGAKNTLE